MLFYVVLFLYKIVMNSSFSGVMFHYGCGLKMLFLIFPLLPSTFQRLGQALDRKDKDTIGFGLWDLEAVGKWVMTALGKGITLP